MKTLSAEDYAQLRDGAKVIAADVGDKVLLLPDGSYVKLFRIKRLFTSARFIPYSGRFADNARRLKALGIRVPEVLEIYTIPCIERTAVQYAPLPGNTLRELGEDFNADVVQKLGAFYRELHGKGIYLRSLHLGNVVLTPEGELGLIDFADMKIYSKPLPKRLRLRNFRHLSRYNADCNQVSTHLEQLITGLDAADLAKDVRRTFR